MITDILNSDVEDTIVFANATDFDLNDDDQVNLAEEPIFVDETRVTDSGATISGQVVAGTEDFVTSLGFDFSAGIARPTFALETRDLIDISVFDTFSDFSFF